MVRIAPPERTLDIPASRRNRRIILPLHEPRNRPAERRGYAESRLCYTVSGVSLGRRFRRRGRLSNGPRGVGNQLQIGIRPGLDSAGRE